VKDNFVTTTHITSVMCKLLITSTCSYAFV